MPEDVPFQIVTRRSRQRALEVEQQQAQARLQASLQAYAQAQTQIQVQIQAQAQAQAHPQTHAQVHAQAQARAQTQAETQAQAHARAQAQTQALFHQGQARDTNNMPTVLVTASTPGRATSRRRGSNSTPSMTRSTPRRRRAQSSATGQPGSTPTRAGPNRPRGGAVMNPRTPRRTMRAGLQVANDQRDTDAGMLHPPRFTAQDMEGHNQLGRGPPILTNPFPAANEDTNNFQDQNLPVLNQGHQDPQMNAVQPVGDLGTLNEFGLTHHEAHPEFPIGSRYLVPGNEALDLTEWLERDALVSASRAIGPSFLPPGPAQPIVFDRCTSPTCPVPIIHERGPYLHVVEPDMEIGLYPFGLSVPPPPVWRMARRLYSGNEQPGDREAVVSFTRNHGWNGTVFRNANGELFMVP